jgi:hypothetical protein
MAGACAASAPSNANISEDSVPLALDAHIEFAPTTSHGFSGRHHARFTRRGQRRDQSHPDT